MTGYLGAKSGAGVYQAIIGLMPPHDLYVEPFAGSAAILRRKDPAYMSLALDLDPAALETIPNMPGLQKLNTCGLEFAETFTPMPEFRTLVYADPPYPHATRTSGARYLHEMTDADHERLAAGLRRLSGLGCKVIVSSYPSTLYDRLFDGWGSRTFQAMTRGGVRTEKVWFNFDPGAVHWHSYAGRNFTDRQRIKRKAARWAARFAELPPAERQAVLAAILSLDPA